MQLYGGLPYVEVPVEQCILGAGSFEEQQVGTAACTSHVRVSGGLARCLAPRYSSMPATQLGVKQEAALLNE